MNDILNPLATLVAAFAGAWLAFRFQLVQKRDDEKRSNIAAGNRALSVLMQQANTLKLFQIDCINPVRESPGRNIEMKPMLPYREDSLQFDFNSLEFLAQPRHHQALFDLSIEENRYREAIRDINVRSRLLFEEIHPRLMSAGFQVGQEYTNEQFRQAIGDLHYIRLKQLTDAVVIHVDRTVESLYAMKDRLRKTLIELYPDGKYINFELLETPPRSIFHAHSLEQNATEPYSHR